MTIEGIAFALRIRSELDVPGIAKQPVPAGTADVEIVVGAAAIPDGIRSGPYLLAGDRLLFHAAGVAKYQITTRGSVITVDASPGADPEHVSALLIATALPAALWMRGDVILHAAAVVLAESGTAVGFAAPSGFGKSKLLAEMLAGGSRVLAEDALCLRVGGGRPVASGLPGCLWARSGADINDPRTRVEVPPIHQSIEVPMAALLLLERISEDQAPSSLRRLRGRDALRAMLSSFHRPLVPRVLGRLPLLLPQVARLTETLPVFAWSAVKHNGRDLPGLLDGQSG